MQISGLTSTTLMVDSSIGNFLSNFFPKILQKTNFIFLNQLFLNNLINSLDIPTPQTLNTCSIIPKNKPVKKELNTNSKNPIKLFVSGVHPKMTNTELDMIFNMATQDCKITEFKLESVKCFKGYGFIEISEMTTKDARIMCKKIKLINSEGRQLNIKLAVERSKANKLIVKNKKKKVLISNQTSTLTQTEFQRYFKKFGKIDNCYIAFDIKTGAQKTFGFVMFKNIFDAENVIAIKNHCIIGDVCCIASDNLSKDEYKEMKTAKIALEKVQNTKNFKERKESCSTNADSNCSNTGYINNNNPILSKLNQETMDDSIKNVSKIIETNQAIAKEFKAVQQANREMLEMSHQIAQYDWCYDYGCCCEYQMNYDWPNQQQMGYGGSGPDYMSTDFSSYGYLKYDYSCGYMDQYYNRYDFQQGERRNQRFQSEVIEPKRHFYSSNSAYDNNYHRNQISADFDDSFYYSSDTSPKYTGYYNPMY